MHRMNNVLDGDKLNCLCGSQFQKQQTQLQTQ